MYVLFGNLPILITAAVFHCKCRNISATAFAIDGNDGESLMIEDRSFSFKSLWNISYRDKYSQSQILTRWYWDVSFSVYGVSVIFEINIVS